MKNNSKPILQAVAIFLLITGGYGLFRVITGFSLLLYKEEMFFMLFPVAFFAGTMYAGYRLLQLKPNGLRLARTIFALQIPSFYVSGFSYFFSTGAWLILSLGSFGFNFNFNFGTSMHIYLGESFGGLSLGINLLALAAWILLGKMEYPKKEEEVKPEDLIPTVKPPTAHRPRETRL